MSRILIVDDEKDIIDLVSLHLANEGCEVCAVTNGLDVLEAAARDKPQLIVLDIMLPGMDGWQVFKQLRTDVRTRGIPVLMLSARSQAHDRINGLEMGADDYLTKPFSVEELNLRIKSLLKRVNIRTEIPEEKVFNVSTFIFDTENLTLTLNGTAQSLTKKEAQILKILYKFKNQVLPREVILNTVWGQDDYFVGRSLDVFITKLRKYLKEDERIQILNIHGVGFKLEIKA